MQYLKIRITLVMICSILYSCRFAVSRYWCGFVYGWYPTTRKHTVYDLLYLLVVFKIQHIEIKFICQNNMPIHRVILCKEILKVLFTSFYISIRRSVDCIKNYILQFLFKISMLRDSIACELCPNHVAFYRAATRVQICYTYPSTPAIFSYLM